MGQPGPENSWLGGSHTESLQVATLETDTIREECIRYKAKECPPEFKLDHEDYFISRLESPWSCYEEDSPLEKIPINIINPKNGKVLEISGDSGSFAVASANGGNSQSWTYKPSRDGGVLLTNIETSETTSFTYNQKEGTLMNEDGLYALNSKKGLKWVTEVKYLADQPQTPWKRY